MEPWAELITEYDEIEIRSCVAAYNVGDLFIAFARESTCLCAWMLVCMDAWVLGCLGA